MVSLFIAETCPAAQWVCIHKSHALSDHTQVMNIVIGYGGSSQVKDNIISLLREREGRERERKREEEERNPARSRDDIQAENKHH